MGLEDFLYNKEHQVMVCQPCTTCLIPSDGGPGSEIRSRPWVRHLRGEPHRLRGPALQAAIGFLSSYELQEGEELRRRRPDRRKPCRPIQGLATFARVLLPLRQSSMRFCHNAAGPHVRSYAPAWKEGGSALSEHQRGRAGPLV